MNTRRRVVFALGTAALVVRTSFAQQASKAHRIGFLLAEAVSGQMSRLEALRAGLRDLGYIEGKNIVIEIRSADSNYDQLPLLAAELARLKVEVLVAFGAKAVAAARSATTSIPIVIPSTGDPVGRGLATSFSSPSGNIVGLDNMGREVYGKRLELLKEALPRLSRIALLINPAQPGSNAVKGTSAPAKSLNLHIQFFEARAQTDFGDVFASMGKARIEAVVVQQDTLFMSHATEIAQLAAKQRLPSTGTTEYAEAGGLIGYGAIDTELYRRAAHFVDRLLKGAKPSDLPIERATKFELVINTKTAKRLGITIPQSILLRANKIIE